MNPKRQRKSNFATLEIRQKNETSTPTNNDNETLLISQYTHTQMRKTSEKWKNLPLRRQQLELLFKTGTLLFESNGRENSSQRTQLLSLSSSFLTLYTLFDSYDDQMKKATISLRFSRTENQRRARDLRTKISLRFLF